jgi:hydrogenase small subunit
LHCETGLAEAFGAAISTFIIPMQAFGSRQSCDRCKPLPASNPQQGGKAMPTPTLQERLAQRGVTRRDFLRFCGLMTATLALQAGDTSRIARALATSTSRLPVVWLEFQSCTGDTMSFAQASNPTLSTILLETLSVNYMETLMVPAGVDAEKGLADTLAQHPGQYVAVVEGAIPTKDGGVYCSVGGRSALSIAQEVCGNSLATIAVGTCASGGGWPAAAPNPTGAMGVRKAVAGIPKLITLPGCPMNVANLAAVFVYYLTNGQWPDTDSLGRPSFAFHEEIHEECPRKHHYEAERFVRQWGDAGHRAGWCLFQMGCRGPETHSNCHQVKWNDGTNWPVGAGHPCVGCTNEGFWDTMSPFYVALEDD